MARRRRQFFDMRFDNLDRPVWWHELGAVIQVVGVILSGNGGSLMLLFPGTKAGVPTAPRTHYMELGIEDWIAVLQQLNSAEYWVGVDESGIAAQVIGKSKRQIGMAIQWTVYRLDGFKCVYCKREGGINGVSLTVDHVIPVDLGGSDNTYNLVSACRSCNRHKGNRHPREWCEVIGMDYGDLLIYLHQREG